MDLPNDLSSISLKSQRQSSFQLSPSDLARISCEKAGASYYVKDEVKPLKKHQDNIEKLLG